MGRKRMVYTPDALLFVEVLTDVPTFSAVTVAPATTAPLWSFTCPETDPVTVWPDADNRSDTAASKHPIR